MSSSVDTELPAVNRYVNTWEKTVQRFRDECQFDPIVEFEGLQIDEIVPSVFNAQSQRFIVFKQRADRMRDAVNKLLEVIRRMTDVLEAKLFRESEELLKPHRVVICVLVTLLRAGGDNGAKHEAIIELIENLQKALSYLPSDLNTMTITLDQSLIQILVETVATVGFSLQILRRKSSKRMAKGSLSEDTTITKHLRTTEMLIKDVQWTQNPFPLIFKLEWRELTEAYKRNAGIDPTSSTWPNTDSPEKVLAFVRSSDAVFKRSDMERSRLQTVLKVLLNKIRVMVDSLPEELQTNCGIGDIAFGSISALIVACKEKKAAFEAVTNTLKTLESRLPRLEAAQGSDKDRSKPVVARVLIQTIYVLGLTVKLLKNNQRFLATLSFVNIAERRSTQDATLNRALDDLSLLARKLPEKTAEATVKPLASIWEQAVEKYIADTNSDYSILQSLGGIGSLDDLKHDVEMRRIEFKRHRETDGEFRELMQPVFGCLTHLLGVVAEGMSMKIQPAGMISGALNLLFEAANSITSTNDIILELFEQMSGYLNRVGIHGPNHIPQGLLVIYVEILAQFLIILGLVTRAIKDGRIVRFVNFTKGGVDEVQVAMKKLNGLLDSEQKMAVTLAASASQRPHPPVPVPKLDTYIPPHVIPPQPLCIGRDNEKAKITDLVLACKSLVILGGGGMGKTTVALTVLHESPIADRFSTRYFIDCDGITTLAMLLSRIADALRIPAGSRDQYLADRLLDALRGKIIVMCLDNFESLWETDSKVTVESWLNSLIALVDLVVLITMRGAERPSGVMHYHVLSPPDFKYALKIFDKISGCTDEFSRQLVSAVDCHPLAVSLLAHQISPETETTESLWKRWQKRGIAVASRSDTERHRLLNLECSIELSLESPRVQADPVARMVLAILAILPDGLASPSSIAQELEICLPNLADLSTSLTTLTKSALAYIDRTGPERFRVLSPIGQYVRARHRAFISADTLDACLQVYAKFIITRDDFSDPQMHTDVPIELINIHSILEHALDDALMQGICPSISIMNAVRVQAEWALYLGTPSVDLLLKGQSIESTPQDILSDYLQCLGKVYYRLDRLEEGESSLLRAVELDRQTRNVVGEGDSMSWLGTLYMQQDRLEEAESSLLRAVELYQQTHKRIGEGDGRCELGKLYMRLDRLEEAESSLLRAVELYQQTHSRLGEGDGRRELGTLYMRLDRLEEAESSLLRAVELYQQTHSKLGEGNGRRELGTLYMRLDRLEEAESALLRAVELYQQTHSKLGEGNGRRELGRLYMRLDRLEEAESSLLRAVELYQQTHSKLGEGNGRRELGRLYMRLDRLEEAESALLRAVELYQQTHSKLGEGIGRCELGTLYMRLDRLDEAESALLRAVELYQQTHDRLGEGNGRVELGRLYMRLNRLEEAESSLLRAVELYQQTHDRLGEAIGRGELGTLYMRLNRLEEAESLLLQAVELYQQTHSRLGEGNGRIELGTLYMRLDRLEEAESSLLRAVESYQHAQSAWGEGNGRSRLGELYTRLDRVDEAEPLLLRSVELHKQARVTDEEGNDRRRLGELYMRQERLEVAETSLLQAVELHQRSQDGIGEGDDRSCLGELYMRQDCLNEAETSLLEAVTLHQHACSSIGEGNDRLRLGKLCLRQDRLSDAEAEANLAIGLYERSQSRSGCESARTLLADIRWKIAQESEHSPDV